MRYVCSGRSWCWLLKVVLSRRSQEWRFIPDSEKEEIGLTFDKDGEFWMSYKDFVQYFDRMEICNLSPDSLTDEDGAGKKKW